MTGWFLAWIIRGKEDPKEVKMEQEREEDIDRLERKIQSVGTQTGRLGLVVFLVGLFMALIEASGGTIILALGLVIAVQGAIIQYVFK